MAMAIEKDLLILPSSRDDIIVLGVDITKDIYENQCAGVTEVNQTMFISKGKFGMILSDHPYIFSYEKGRLLEDAEVGAYFD